MGDIRKDILGKAKELGADIAGIAAVESLKRSPSSRFLEAVGAKADGVYWDPGERDLERIDWPSGAQSALVVGVSHPETAPQLDYWSHTKGGTPGNRILMEINRGLSLWIEETFGFQTHRMPYGVTDGGIYLKDAAVFAGLGCIGLNNLLITPDYGSRIRLRALLIDARLPPTGPIAYDPCGSCGEFCRKACPQGAFENQVYVAAGTGLMQLPGRNGDFSRARCKIKMGLDVDASESRPKDTTLLPNGKEGKDGMKRQVIYCRQCEIACPVGNGGS